MSKNVAVFVDVANLYYSARGQDVDVDYVALLKAATKGRDLIRAYAYSGLDPENENQRKFIDFLTKNGYKVVHKDIRKFGDGRMKANLDIELVVDLFRLQDRMDIAVIVSGDGDFAPAIRALQDVGVRCEVISFRPNTSSDLIAVADEFLDIMKIIDIGRKKESARSRSMSAPEMPAKEVNPEFGFREASPHVAAAALAAIKGGGNSTRRRSTAAARNGEPAEPANGTEVATAEEARDGGRRRRRRGGRGRGRGRREEGMLEPAASESGEPAEITWQELDDLSQLEGAEEDLVSPEEREITFSEVDAETLAELGISAPPVSGDATDAEGAAEKPARRRRSTKATTATDAVAEPSEEQEPAKPARRRRSTKPSETATDDPGTAASKPAIRRRRSTKAETTGADTESADTESAAKPARRRRTTKRDDPGGADAAAASRKEAATAPASGDEAGASDAPQGIWQRFRSARTGH